MFARLSAFVIWSIVAAAIVFWAFRLGVSGTPLPPYAVAVDRSAPLRGDLARLFGAGPVIAVATPDAPVEAPSRYKLVGVMAPRGAAVGEGGYGLALIAVDGKPARAYPVGARLDGDFVLQAVSLRTASLGPAAGGRSTLLELPALPPPATGVLPPPGGVPTMAPPPIAGRPMTPAMPVPSAVPPTMAQPIPPQMQPQPPAAPQMQPPGQPVPAMPQVQPADNFRTQ